MIESGTYRLGTLTNVELKAARSAVVKITIADTAVLDETLYSEADGIVRIARLNELIEPYCNVGASTTVTVKVDNTTYTLTVTYHLQTDGNDATVFDDTLDGVIAHEGVAPIRIFSFVNADGVTTSVKVFGIETEHPEITSEYGVVKGIETLIEARYVVKHEIETARLSGREIRVLTGLLTSELVMLNGHQVIIDVDAELVRWMNNPQEDRVAKFAWRYADYDKAYNEYDGVLANMDNSRLVSYGETQRTFAFGGNMLKLWGTEAQKREYESAIVLHQRVQNDVDKHYRIAHTFNTDRMSRNELRALVLMATSASLTLGGVAVVVKDLQVNISSDPQSDRTASFTWYYADVRRREDE